MTATTTVFDRIESRVRSYSRSFPALFDKARNATLYGADGREYIDFLAGCSSLNYGHNDPDMQAALVDYIRADGIAHGLDMFTGAKQDFLTAYERIILKPRGMDYRLMFTGPTGTNAVEAALKLARKATGRTTVIAFTNGFHGMSLGALAATGNAGKREGAGVDLPGVHRAPFEGYFGPGVDTADMLEQMLDDPSGGIGAPAAILVEPVQGEGGLHAASAPWMQKIERIARRHGALFIVDDIQAGCGRVGTFFSFEGLGVSPDIVTQAKSLSGMGLPFALTLFKPEYDIWKPGEHNGTFRGNNHAFVTARVALEKFWHDDSFAASVRARGEGLRTRLAAIADRHGMSLRGRGMMQGIDTGDGATAARICALCFENGLIIETSGGHDEVVKILCPLTIEDRLLNRGLDILDAAFAEVLGSAAARTAAE
ncbi:diaminobutyrate--2-oxoglutarate transaminase [Ruixingdingia sedimenti]|uniref:Diaminobutyrate--2-oxoglutarate transaminase n=1 Tax=Ruixingdingia sedimenti TaxID=3073604 RepID=A0ABU1FAV3_9RHOB|nr:diaminobutyrate--2-oxoglutarate transaminase [Xinfangfangia sp. LG-4]MDR5654019.1 diaminobutyrate--2-oxoglutarate transaminase [Xinfangfangia sp. LG-4]